MTVSIRTAALDEISRLAEFMASRLGAAVGRGSAHYRRYLEYRWRVDRPDAGIVIEDDGELHGVIGTIYSEREIAGARHLFCNLTSIAVDESHRKHSLQAFATLFRRKDITFTVFSASEAVQKILAFFKFTHRPSTRVIVPFVGGAFLRRMLGKVRVVTKHSELVRELDGAERRIAEDHAHHHCAQLLVERGNRRSHVIAVRRGHGARVFADVLYASDRALCIEEMGALLPSLALALRTPLIGFDGTWIAQRPALSARYSKLRPVYARSPSLALDTIDALYSELVASH